MRARAGLPSHTKGNTHENLDARALVEVFANTLGNLSRILEKGLAHATQRKFDRACCSPRGWRRTLLR